MLNIEAEKIAVVLGNLVVNFNFGNINAFDENTSHIIVKNGMKLNILARIWSGKSKNICSTK